MPTKADLRGLSNELEALRMSFHEPCHSWTDDLPVCSLSGVGFSTNQKYRPDGFRREEHSFEDTSFHFRYDDDTYFYGIFDGHVGTRAADFASQRMPAEILLGQLKDKATDKEIKELLHQAFLAVEKSFFESIDDLLAEKENLRLQLQGLRTIQAVKQYPNVVQRLKCVTEEIQSSTTAVVALIHKDRLYAANVGDSRALLCQEDNSGKTNVYQLTCDHVLSNEDEMLRLSLLGLDVAKIIQEQKPGQQTYTRCIGNYTVKGGYKEFDNFSEAVKEPVIAEPDIVGGINVDERCKFLLLMSKGLYQSLEEATETSNVNNLIVNMLLEQFAEQSTLNGVAQAVVDKVVRIHHDAFTRDESMPRRFQKRDDITLLVRNFSCDLPNAHNTSVSRQTSISVQSKASSDQSPNLVNPSGSDATSDIPSMDNFEEFPSSVFINEIPSLTSSSDSFGPPQLFQSGSNVSLDSEGRVKPYVDFSEFYAAVEEAYNEGLVSKEWLKPDT